VDKEFIAKIDKMVEYAIDMGTIMREMAAKYESMAIMISALEKDIKIKKSREERREVT